MSNPPDRTADTMSMAIAMSSPNGRMSARSKAAATEQLRVALFGQGGLQRPQVKQPTKAEHLRRSAANLRDLAARGMRPRANIRDAEAMEREADALELL